MLRVAFASRTVTVRWEVWLAPALSWAETIVSTLSVWLRASSVRALAERWRATVALWPPASLNAPVASVRMAAFALPARTAVSVRSVIVPVQPPLSAAGQLTFAATSPEGLALRVAPMSSASGTAGATLAWMVVGLGLGLVLAGTVDCGALLGSVWRMASEP